MDFGISSDAFVQAAEYAGISDFSVDDLDMVEQLIADPDLFLSVKGKSALIQSAQNYAALEGADLTSFVGLEATTLSIMAPELASYGLSVDGFELAARNAGFDDFSANDVASITSLLEDPELLQSIAEQAAIT